MAQLVYKTGQRRHLFAVRQAGARSQGRELLCRGGPGGGLQLDRRGGRDSPGAAQRLRYSPPYVVVHVTGYMLALTHQGQEGFRVWVIEIGREIHEQYIMSLVDMVRAAWTVRKTQ